MLTPIKRLFGGAPTPEPQDGTSETQGTPTPDPPTNEAEYYITLGKTTLHDWQPNPHNRGVLHRGTTYQDMAAAMARKELYHEILATQPWNIDLSDSVTSPVRLFPDHKARPNSPTLDALSRMNPGDTALWTMPLHTARKMESFTNEGQQIVWTANQTTLVSAIIDAVERMPQQESQARYPWVILETQIRPVGPANVMLQLDGRGIMRKLRRKMVAAILNKSRYFQVARTTSLEQLDVARVSMLDVRMVACLLSNIPQWLPYQDLPIRYLQNPHVFDPQVEVPPRTYRLLLPKSVEKRTPFYRFVNSSTDDASSVARRNSVFRWTGATRIAAPDYTSYLWEYQIPQVLHDRIKAFLERPSAQVQWLDLTDHEKLYIVLQAKPNKGKEGIQDIKSAEDLAVELAASMGKDKEDDVPLPRPPFLTEVFPTGMPHMWYQRIVTLANENQVSEVARRLWQNSRLVLKKLTTDCRVRFGVWGAGTEEDRQRAPRELVLDGQALIIVLPGLSEAIVRKYAALFGLHRSVDSRGVPHIGAHRVHGHVWPQGERYPQPRCHVGLYAW